MAGAAATHPGVVIRNKTPVCQKHVHIESVRGKLVVGEWHAAPCRFAKRTNKMKPQAILFKTAFSFLETLLKSSSGSKTGLAATGSCGGGTGAGVANSIA